MPFLRPGHPQAPVSSLLKSTKRRQQRRNFGLLTLCSLTAPSAAHAKPFRPVGVKAWTSGTQTYIRARPGVNVPPVAKVGRHTPLYVWGKYNGWYRVETHDHIFGWVFNEFIETPKAYKVRDMSASKARLASDRTAHHTMYGTPAELKKFYATYGAPGALKGLREHGIIIAAAPKNSPKSITKPKVILATGNKTTLAKTVARSNGKRPLVRVAGTGRDTLTKNEASSSVIHAPGIISPVPTAERIEKRVAVMGAKPVVRVETRAPRAEEKRAIASALSGRMNVFEAPRVDSLDQKPVATFREGAPTPREVESGKIADSARGLTPSAKFFARAAVEAAQRPSAIQNSAPSDAPLTNSNFEPIPFKAPVSVAPVAPRVKISTPAPKRVVKKPAKKTVARKSTKRRYVSRRDIQRQQLRARMGLAPAVPHSVIAPVSSSDLMRARQQYLAERKARLGLPSSPATEVPVVGLAPLPIPSGPLGGPSSDLPPTAPGEFAPMAFEPSHPLAPLLGNPYIVSMAQLKGKSGGGLSAVTALKPYPVGSQEGGAVRGGSPRDRGAKPLRGGSPRDRFGSGMASQALSYRGMRYIRGAASPSRGFDCSGLIYYLLRQRGYNPPRTAAGYRSWGQSVGKKDLKSGDLLLFANTYKRGISHIGVYLGEGKFVHAATSSTGVRVSSLKEAYYARKYYGARRAK